MITVHIVFKYQEHKMSVTNKVTITHRSSDVTNIANVSNSKFSFL